MNLYQINLELAYLTERAWAFAEDNDGIIPEDLAAQIDELELAKDQKRESLACLIKNLKADAEAYKAEKLAFAKRQAAAESKIDYLAKYLQKDLEADVTDKKKKFEFDHAVISFRSTKTAVIDDLTALSDEFVRVKVEPDKNAIKTAIMGGETVAGAHLEEGLSMSIK